MSDFSTIVRGYQDRLAVANKMAVRGQWSECAEQMCQLISDVRSCKIVPPTKEEQDGKAAFLKALDRNLKHVQQNARDEEDLIEQMNRQSGSPEPPADPVVWSKPSPPNQLAKQKRVAGKPREPSKSVSSMSTASLPTSNSVDSKPVSSSILPPNAAGETFDTSAYENCVVQAAYATMTMVKDNTVSLDDIIGMQDVKEVLHEAITLPLLVPDFFKGLRRPWKAMCLAGPPGTGKTLIGRAAASESNCTCFNVTPSDFSSKWRGDSEKILRLVFELARFYAPSIMFIDEIDTIGGQRGSQGEHEASRRLKAEMLVQMDGVKSKSDERRVFVLAATNFPWHLDEALRRRFEKRIFVPMPDKEARKKLIVKSMEETPVCDVDYDDLAAQLEGFSGADVVSVCRTAAYNVLRRYNTKTLRGGELAAAMESLKTEPVRKCDFDAALGIVSSSVDPDVVTKCKEWCDTFGAG